MTGPIRKKAGIPGQEKLNEGCHPEKSTNSRTGEAK